MNSDLISRSEAEKLGATCLARRNENGQLEAIISLDNAPTVEQKEFEQILQPIKVNIPEDVKDKLIEEMSKPRKVILDESKTVQDCIIAYNDGLETARRLFEIPHGEWIKRNDDCFDWFECSVCGYGSDGEITRATPFCPICGADMRKGESE